MLKIQVLSRLLVTLSGIYKYFRLGLCQTLHTTKDFNYLLTYLLTYSLTHLLTEIQIFLHIPIPLFIYSSLLECPEKNILIKVKDETSQRAVVDKRKFQQ